MNDIHFLIPSYGRAGEVRTVGLLAPAVPKERIVVSTQTKEDFKAYSELYSKDATVIFKEEGCVGGNRNTAMEWGEEHGLTWAVMMDDDIRGLSLAGGTVTDPWRVVAMVTTLAERSRNKGASLWGVFPVDNNVWFSEKVTEKPVTGRIFGINDMTLRFDPYFRIKEDYELCLRVIARGGRVMRFDFLAAFVTGSDTGGASEDQRAPGRRIYADMLEGMYPTLCKVNRKGEMIFKERK